MRWGKWLLIPLLLLASCARRANRVEIFCSAAVMVPMNKIVQTFEEKHYTPHINVSYFGVGTITNRLILGNFKPDILVTSSSKYMDKLEKENLIVHKTRKKMCKLIPAILVKKGNPKGIKGIEDLKREDVVLGIGIPDVAALGDIARRLLSEVYRDTSFKNVNMLVGSGGELYLMLLTGKVDAIIGWREFEAWSPEHIEAIPLPRKFVKQNTQWAEVALTVYGMSNPAAREFYEFMLSSPTKKILKKYKYEI